MRKIYFIILVSFIFIGLVSALGFIYIANIQFPLLQIIYFLFSTPINYVFDLIMQINHMPDCWFVENNTTYPCHVEYRLLPYDPF